MEWGLLRSSRWFGMLTVGSGSRGDLFSRPRAVVRTGYTVLTAMKGRHYR